MAVYRIQPGRTRGTAPGKPQGHLQARYHLDPDELAAWLEVAVDDRDAGIWVLAATTGMRRAELAGAERELLDLDNATLEIADTRVVVDGKADESDGKTEGGRRVISPDPLTVAYLRRRLAMLDTEREALGDDYHDAGWLVCHPDGRPVHPDTITEQFSRLVDRPGSSASASTTCDTPTPDQFRCRDGPEDRGRPDRAHQHGLHARHLHPQVDRQGSGRGRNRSRCSVRHRVDMP